MSVQSEITRLANAKTALATAIEGKGVTVPEGTKLDGMAALVESIEAGGGLALEYNRLKDAASGTFTVVERTVISDSNRFIFEHNAGVIPFLFIITASQTSAQNDLLYMVSFRIGEATVSRCKSFSARRALSSGYALAKYSTEAGTISGGAWDEQYVSIVSYGATIYLNTGITYTWEAYYIE